MEQQKQQKTSIAIIGAGYVGMSLGALLSQAYKVSFLDINLEAVSYTHLTLPTKRIV